MTDAIRKRSRRKCSRRFLWVPLESRMTSPPYRFPCLRRCPLYHRTGHHLRRRHDDVRSGYHFSMRGIFLVSCLLGGGALLTGCRDDGGPRPATGRCARIPARASGGKPLRSAKTGTGTRRGPALPIPDDLPSPELVGTTRQIHQLIESTGTPARFESYTEAVPRRELPCA